MDAALQNFIDKGLAASTKRTYGAGARHFHEFCTKYNIFNPFPITEHTLCYFATYLATLELSPQTIKTYLSAARNQHVSLGFPDPRDQSSLPLLKRVQAGIQRVQAMKPGNCKRVRLPVTPRILELLRAHWESSQHPEKVLLWAVATLCFAGFFRSGELLSTPTTQHCLSWGDVSLDSQSRPSVVCVRLRFSKCDQFREGVSVFVGRSDSVLCPVAAVVAYMVRRGSSPGVFFRLRDGNQLSRFVFVAEVKKALRACGVDQAAYSGHSFRIGAATAAASAGLPDSMIQTLGRWSSAAFLAYIRTPRRDLAAATAAILQQ